MYLTAIGRYLIRDTNLGLCDAALDSDFLSAPHPDEIKDGQWLGVSVRSQGPGLKAVVCAHRYYKITTIHK